MNMNPETGVRYGIIACNSLDSDRLHDLLYVFGRDLSYEEAVKEETARQRKEFDDAVEIVQNYGDWADIAELPKFRPDLNSFDPQLEEPIHEGDYKGVKYRTTWLGGAQMLWVFDSPHRVLAAPCSPCVPGAGDLDNVATSEAALDGAVLTYDVPADWRV